MVLVAGGFLFAVGVAADSTRAMRGGAITLLVGVALIVLGWWMSRQGWWD
jgi:hypothetical protein